MPRGNLVLTRKAGQVIWIEDVLIRVQSVRGDKVSLCIEADTSCKIVREELLVAEQLAKLPTRKPPMPSDREKRKGPLAAFVKGGE